VQFYSNPERASDTYAMPDCEVFELTAREVAEQDDDLIYEYMKRHEFRLAAMNSRDRDKMFDAMIEEEGITGGWFYWYCFPGCLPEGFPIGPYKDHKAAIKACQEEANG
jgi:hypothetical protein